MSNDVIRSDCSANEYEYDLTVIVPIYNGEKFLSICLDSLVNQTLSKRRYEVLLIDDGSVDGSADICKTYEEKYEIFRYEHKENSGVSDTRNIGIRKARGRYITFLDCDDYISKETLQYLVDFFMKHEDEVDIVTYTMLYENEQGKTYKNARYKLLKETAVYSIDENIHIDQTTMNICVKNEKEPILFDTKFSMAEDQLYISEWIARKRTIGFVEQATYYYRRHSGAATSFGNNPYYCFDQMIEFFERLRRKFLNSDGTIDVIAQALILYNLGWRIRGDVLFPYHYDKENFDDAVEKIRSYVSLINDEIIISCPHLDKSHRLYLLKFKGYNKANIDKNGVFTLAGDTDGIFTTDTCMLVVKKTFIKNNKFLIDGFVKTSASEFFPVELFVQKNSEDKETVELKQSSFSKYGSKITTNTFYAFSQVFDIDETSEATFTALINGVEVPTTFFLSKSCSMNFSGGRLLNGNILVKVEKIADNSQKIVIKKISGFSYVFEKLKVENAHRKRSFRGFLTRNIIRKSKKAIWVYSDRNDIVDNALYQFQHDISKKDGVKRYYIADNPEKFFSLIPEEMHANIIKRNSFKHKKLFLNSSKLLFSFSSLSAYSPFGNAAYAFYCDIMDTEQIYLQHGVLHARLPLLYDKERYNFNKVVVSTNFELDNMVRNYGYDRQDLIPSGMPRYDTFKMEEKATKKILLAPSWRSNLIGALVNNKRQLRVADFLASGFYNEISALLSSEKLTELLEKYDLELVFKNHPIFEPYNEYFEIKSERVKLISGPIDLSEYSLMITDYSSFIFDFAYLERAIVYFVPDYDMFKAGLSSPYRELDLPLEDGLGPFVQDADSLIKEIEILAKTEFRPSTEYEEKMNGFFITKENHCEKLYDYLMEN